MPLVKQRKEEEKMRRTQTDDDDVVKWILVGGAALAGAFGLYYLVAGAGPDKDAALVPNSLEDKLDRVVSVLNQRLGKAWVDRGLNYLQSFLAGVLPAPLVGLVGAVYQAEIWAKQQRSYGYVMPSGQKRSFAAEQARA
jgi:hypothetical protein